MPMPRSLELARDVEADADRDAARAAIGGYGAALELVDLGPVAGGPAGVVATNVFHRAVAFAPVTCARMPTGVSGRSSSAARCATRPPRRPTMASASDRSPCCSMVLGSGCARATC
jgi:hypothetical protein